MRAPLSLRSQQLLIVGGLLGLLLVESIVSYSIGSHITNQVLDRWLLDSVHTLAEEIRVTDGNIHSIPDKRALDIFQWDAVDEIFFEVRTQNGEVLTSNARVPVEVDLQALEQGHVFTDLMVNGKQTRAVSVLEHGDGNTPLIVTVAETLNKRKALTIELLLEVLLSKGILVVAVLIIISVVFERGIRPLYRISKELAQRSPQDLTPLKIGNVPRELRGLLESTNSLLSRIDGAITSREQFIGNIAHQIRTPLAGMKLQAQLALEEHEDIADIHTALERIVDAADRMDHANSQLMKLARAEAAFGRGLRNESVDLVALIRNCCHELAWRAQDRRIKLALHLPDGKLCVPGEMTLLHEMVSNLVENAIVYGNEEGTVWIALTDKPAGPCIEIEDDGPGIPTEHWPRIFDRFFRTNPESGSGCGLGLAIVREIALAHGAVAHLEHREASSGIRFVVQFGAEGPG